MRRSKLLGLAYVVGILLCLPSTARTQPPSGFADPNSALGTDKGVLGEGDRAPKLEAGFTTPEADGSSQLFIILTLPSGAHTYSVTQPEGGPIRTEIKVSPLDAAPTIGKFQPVRLPKIVMHKDEFDVAQEEHFNSVKWVAPLKFAAGAKPETIKIEGKVNMQLCDASGCVAPKDYPFTAGLRADAKPEKPATKTPAASRSATKNGDDERGAQRK
jgi:suppressor for copper-sensitivity B